MLKQTFRSEADEFIQEYVESTFSSSNKRSMVVGFKITTMWSCKS